MNERRSNDLISADFDSETTPQEHDEARRLLDGTSEARREREEIGAISQWMRSLPRHSAPNELLPTILRRLERESLLPPEPAASAAGSSLPTWLVAAGSVAATAAVLLVTAQFLPDPRAADSGTIQSPASTATKEPDDRTLADRSTETQDLELRERLSERAAGSRSRTARQSSRRVPTPGLNELAGESSPQSPAPAGQAEEAPQPAPSSAHEPRFETRPAPADADKVAPVKKLDDVQWGAVEIGEVIPYLQSRDDHVAVIELWTVVDVREAVDTVQVLLAKHSVPQLVDGTELGVQADLESEGALAENKERRKQQLVEGKNGRLAVYVETTEPQLAAALDELGSKHVIADLKLQRPASASHLQVTGGGPDAGLKPQDGRNGQVVVSESLEVLARRGRKLRDTPSVSKAAPARSPAEGVPTDRQDRDGEVQSSEEPEDRAVRSAVATSERPAPAVAPTPDEVRSRLTGRNLVRATTAGRKSPGQQTESQAQSFQLLVNLPDSSLDDPTGPAPSFRSDRLGRFQGARGMVEKGREDSGSDESGGPPIRVLLVFQQGHSAGTAGAQEQ